jgi:hypothetical protein
MIIKTEFVIVVLILLFVIFRGTAAKVETYRSLQSAYAYGEIDTNPTRRVAGAFDRCSPENFEDCRTL